MKKTCEYSKCGAEFETNDPKKRFCCDQHRWNAHKEVKRKSLGESPLQDTDTTTAARTQVFTSPRPQMDSMTAFLFHKMENEIKELKDELREKNNAIDKAKEDREKMVTEFAAKEKEFDRKVLELQTSIDAKPTGLQGFVQTSAFEKFLEGIAPEIGPRLGKMIDKFSGPDSPHAEAITKWMLTLPEQMRNDFLVMLNSFMQLPPEKIGEKMNDVSRSLMAPSHDVKEQQQPKKKVGTNFWS